MPDTAEKGVRGDADAEMGLVPASLKWKENRGDTGWTEICGDVDIGLRVEIGLREKG